MNDKTIVTLVTVPKKEHLVHNTLIFDTIRTAFPNCPLKVWDNSNDPEMRAEIETLTKGVGGEFFCSVHRWHHADWIEMIVNTHDWEVVIVDPDTIWYESFEDFQFPTLLAGRFIPVIWNEFAGAISYERLHTSCLWINDCKELRERLVLTYPPAHTDYGPYSPLNPYRPAVQFYGGYPMFWDTCSTLFNMVGGTCFTEAELKRYAHVNSAAFQDVMLERLSDKGPFLKQHEEAGKRNYPWFREWWKAEDKYYMKMHNKAKYMLAQRNEGKRTR